MSVKEEQRLLQLLIKFNKQEKRYCNQYKHLFCDEDFIKVRSLIGFLKELPGNGSFA